MSERLSKKIRKETRKIMGDIGEGTREMFRGASQLPLKKRLVLAFLLLIGHDGWDKPKKRKA